MTREPCSCGKAARDPRPLGHRAAGALDNVGPEGDPMSPRDLTIPGRAPPRKGAPPRRRPAEEARLDPGQGADLRGLPRTRDIMRETPARHRLRGGGLPERRRMLEPGPRHHDDHGRDLHPRLHLLQRGHRAPRRARRVRAGARGDAVRSWVSPMSSSRASTATISTTGVPSTSPRRSAPCATARPETTIEILTPDFLRCGPEALETVVAARPGRLQPQPRDRARPLPRGAARRALLPFAAASAAGEGARPRDVHQVRHHGGPGRGPAGGPAGDGRHALGRMSIS
jgi:hypothetical protein